MFVCLIGKHYNLTVRLLEARAGTASTILLWLTTTRITHKQSSVVVLESLLQLILGGFVNVLGVVGNNRLCNGGPNSVDLSCDTSTLYSDADIQIGELVLSKDQDWFEDLQTHNFRFNVLNGLAIDLDKTPTLLRKGNSGGCLLSAKNTNKQKRERDVRTLCVGSMFGSSFDHDLSTKHLVASHDCRLPSSATQHRQLWRENFEISPFSIRLQTN